MTPAIRQTLAATFESEIRALQRMLGWDLSAWRVDPPEATDVSYAPG